MSERNVTGPQTLIHNLRFGPLPIINYITLCGLFCGCFLFLSFISGCKFATLLSSSNAVVSIRRRMKAALKSRFHIREQMIEHLRERFKHLNFVYSIGGQISFDVMPQGWTKEYALRFLPEKEYSRIVFIGDKCFEGGNDWEIFSHPRVEGYAVQNPGETIVVLRKLFPQIETLLDPAVLAA
jgi:hypothetical protein